MLLLAVLLVNLPWVHQAWVDHRIAVAGRPVTADVLATEVIRGRYLVDYRLVVAGRPSGGRFSARVDRATWRTAQRTHRLPVLVVPGHPAQNRPVGEVGSSLFVVVAAIGDALVAAVLAMFWWRWRRWHRRVVVRVEGDLVTFTMGGHELTAVAPQSWADRRTPGTAVRAALHVVAASDLRPALPVSELRHENGATYLLRGRVADVDRRHVLLRLDDGLALPVLPGAFRNRADLREYAELTGRLVLQPPG